MQLKIKVALRGKKTSSTNKQLKTKTEKRKEKKEMKKKSVYEVGKNNYKETIFR